MLTPTNIHNPPALMGIQDPNPLANSLVYEFLRTTAHAKIAFEFKHHFGPFKYLNGLTLEKLYVIYKKKFNVIPTISIPPSQTLVKSKKKVNSTKPENIPVPSSSHAVIKSNKKVNSLVYNFLVRNYHFDVASEFMKLVGSSEDVRGGPVLEEMYIMYKEKFNVTPSNSMPPSQTLIKSKNKVNSNGQENIPVPSTSHAVIKSNNKN